MSNFIAHIYKVNLTSSLGISGDQITVDVTNEKNDCCGVDTQLSAEPIGECNTNGGPNMD